MLPADLLQAISDPGGGRVVIVAGAGCSFEPPTSLPLSVAVSIEAHRKLRADGVLTSDCLNPADLSCVADAVFEVRGLQKPLVDRLPKGDFRNAQPNEGHLLAAALLRERAISCVLTVNFDLAFSTALAIVGANHEVATITGPEHFQELGAVNLVYLHRNVDAPPEEWILRTAALDEEWKGNWEEIVARRVLTGPVTVFVGLGSACGVLTETARHIREAIPTDAVVFQVGPGTFEESNFAADLELAEGAFVQKGWVEFMRELATRVLVDQQASIGHACQQFIDNHQASPESVGKLDEQIGGLGLMRLGKLRARWLLEDSNYAPHGADQAKWVADLLLCVALIERMTGTEAVLHEDGVVEFWRGTQQESSIILGHGRGTCSNAAIEARLGVDSFRQPHRVAPRFALVCGVTRTPMTAPRDILGDIDKTDIVTAGTQPIELVLSQELRRDPVLANRLIA